MARTFKLKCRLFISSFRFCRPKQHPLTFPQNPLPKSYHKYKQFPASPRACEICYPNPPSPPPSTPVGFFAGRLSAKTTVSVCCSCKLKSYARENGLHVHVAQKGSRTETDDKVAGEEIHRSSPFSWITRKKTKKKEKNKKKAKKKVVHKSNPMANNWSNGYDGEEDEASEALINSSISFSEDVSPVKRTSEDEVVSRSRSRILYLPEEKEKRGNERTQTATSLPGEESPAEKGATWEKMPRKVEGKLGESFVQVKKSKQPYEDFKRSMVQMILEKEIFEAKGLEELLQCYLSLNSPEYHRVIVGAFSEVWEFLFLRLALE